MCLTIPQQIIAIKDKKGIINFNGHIQELISIIKIQKGDWVLVQNDIIIKKITENLAQKINKILYQNE